MRKLSSMILMSILAGSLVTPVSSQGGEGSSGVDSPAKPDLSRGWADYQRYCTNCHGEEGRGDGAIAKWLKIPPADLTQVSESHDGEFPEERIVLIIDGREEVRLHGLREMPIWGDVFQSDQGGEDEVRQKIANLVAVIRSIDKPAPAEN